MNKMFFFAVLLLIGNVAFAQQGFDTIPRYDATPPLTAADYMKKSRTQYLMGGSLLSGSIITLTLTAVDAAASKAVNGARNFVGVVFGGGPPVAAEKRSYLLPISLGIASMVGGILLLNEAKENKMSATSASAYLKMENAPTINSGVKTMEVFPSLAVKIKL